MREKISKSLLFLQTWKYLPVDWDHFNFFILIDFRSCISLNSDILFQSEPHRRLIEKCFHLSGWKVVGGDCPVSFWYSVPVNGRWHFYFAVHWVWSTGCFHWDMTKGWPDQEHLLNLYNSVHLIQHNTSTDPFQLSICIKATADDSNVYLMQSSETQFEKKNIWNGQSQKSQTLSL